MTTRMQVTIDCADPARLVRFWALALGYQPEPPPAGFANWIDYWRSVGVPADEFVGDDDGCDSVVDPTGVGPRVWFQKVPEAKTVKNRVHLDLDVGGGRRTPLEPRRKLVDAAADRLVEAGATRVRVLDSEAIDHYGVVMTDPEGNEFCLH